MGGVWGGVKAVPGGFVLGASRWGHAAVPWGEGAAGVG